MKKINFYTFGIAILFLTACHDDLNQNPIDPDLFTEVDVYQNSEEALGALAKVYGSLALTGQQGPAGAADIDPSVIDEGFSQYSRVLFKLNELTTDNAVVGWGDPGLPELHLMAWGTDNQFVKCMYFRLSQVVSFSNSFIENANLMTNKDSNVDLYISEARFIRAYAYLQLMDLFGNVPLVTEIQFELPSQASRSEIFQFVETELLDLESKLSDSRGVDYGRVDKDAASALLTRLYLNAEVYTGEARYSDVIAKAESLMSSTPYSINTNDGNNNGSAYDELFLADNNSNGAQNEFIFVLQFDGLQSQTWGGATFMVHAPVGGNMNPADFGINGGWGGLRTTKGLVDKFSYSVTSSNASGEPISWSDGRALFFTDGQNYEITKIPPFKEGYAVAKFKNVDVNGNPGSDSSGDHPDTDLPIIRLAEVYLNYAEAIARVGGNTQNATDKINELRDRSGAPQISSSDLSVDFVLEERQRELYWEGQRRTDLVRANQFVTSNYLWPFKAGAATGKASDDHRRIYPIPVDILLVNKNLTQNQGY